MSFNSIDQAGDCFFNGFSFSKPSLVNLPESPHIGCARRGPTSARTSTGREVPVTLRGGAGWVLAHEALSSERIKCRTLRRAGAGWHPGLSALPLPVSSSPPTGAECVGMSSHARGFPPHQEEPGELMLPLTFLPSRPGSGALCVVASDSLSKQHFTKRESLFCSMCVQRD